MTIAEEHEAGRSRAVTLDAPTGAVAFTGPAGSGKSTALALRAAWLAARLPHDRTSHVLLSSANARAVRTLASCATTAGVAVRTLDDLALEALCGARLGSRLLPEPDVISDARAARVFEEIGAALFALDWTEYVTPEIDPEISGISAPRRFAAAAFRLIRRLRAADIDVARFRSDCARGTADFYGRLPNLANPDLLTSTKSEHRDSLTANAAELDRQRLRELDLTRILSRLFESYAESLNAAGCLTTADAVALAAREVALDPQLGTTLRAAYPFACIDDAQDLTKGHTALLHAIYGKELRGVTLAGDQRQRTQTFAGASGDAVMRGAAETIVFDGWLRGAPAIANVALRGLDPHFAAPPAVSLEGRPPDVAFARGRDVEDEARIVAEFVTEAIAAGTPARDIAIVMRGLPSAPPYLDALLARGVDCDLEGDGSIFTYRIVRDVLAALWILADPFDHAYLLRTLESPWMRLSDASIARLCAEPSNAQAPLFEIEGEPSEARGRWDRRRDFRLAQNVTGGDADLDLTPVARERLGRLRAAIARWELLERDLELPELVRAIGSETAEATLSPGARGSHERNFIARFYEMVDEFSRARPLATLHEMLVEFEATSDGEASLLAIDRRREDAVSLLDVEASKGREFALVLIVDVRSGAFPRYYSPDAFLFTPTFGIVPKENVGGKSAARTAKFTYTMFRMGAQKKFIDEERRAFYVAASRARERLVVTAWGEGTKGGAAPEILKELCRAGIPGTAEVTRSS